MDQITAKAGLLAKVKKRREYRANEETEMSRLRSVVSAQEAAIKELQLMVTSQPTWEQVRKLEKEIARLREG
jgi:uncharacterized coiled-coil protein SlyX